MRQRQARRSGARARVGSRVATAPRAGASRRGVPTAVAATASAHGVAPRSHPPAATAAAVQAPPVHRARRLISFADDDRRASPMSRPLFRIASPGTGGAARAPSGRRPAGNSAVQTGASRVSTAASVSETSSPSERVARPSASRRARSRTPRCRCACRPSWPLCLLGRHVGGRAQNHPRLRHRGRRDRRRHRQTR